MAAPNPALDARCTCGHSLGEHDLHDPGRCRVCERCGGYYPAIVLARCAVHGLAEHGYSAEEVVRLLELFSGEDFEDGPRCLRKVIDAEDDIRAPYEFERAREAP